jgi:hypothetical protein
MKQAHISRLIFIPSGSYHDMALRPYTARVTGPDMDRLETFTGGFKDLSPHALSGIAGTILRPSAVDVGTISIDNGWNERRYMFMMEVIYPNESPFADDGAVVNVKYVSGYTDRIGDPSYSGHIDPQMRMFLSTVMDTNEINTSRGIRRKPVATNRYLQQNNGQGYNRNSHFYALRPRDVCSAIGNAGLGDFVDTDYRSAMSARPILSNINNDLPTDYLSRVFEGHRLVMNNVNNASLTDDIPSLMSQIGNATKDLGSADDQFITQLTRNTELCEGSCFSYGELCMLFPGTDNIAMIQNPQDTLVRDIGFAQHQPNDTQVWFGSNNETIVATIAGSAVPALMTGALLTQVSFTCTNDTVDGQPVFEWHSPAMSFILHGQSLEDQMSYFRDRMMMEVFNDMSRGGNMTLTISVFSDLVMADTRIEIEVDGNGRTPYCVPNFASSLITPVVGNNRTQLDSLASSVHDIFSNLGPSSLETPSNTEYAQPFSLSNQSFGSAVKSRTAPAAPPSSGGGWKL